MEWHKITLLVSGVIFCAIISSCQCFRIPPEVLDKIDRIRKANITMEDNTMNCQFSTTKGRRRRQEDRLFCNLDHVMLFHGNLGGAIKKVGVVAVFDGHIGEEASDMASKIFEMKFLHSTDYVNKQTDSGYGFSMHYRGPDDVRRFRVEDANSIIEGTDYFQVLKEALPRTIKRIDGEIAGAAVAKKLVSGTTAVIALLVDNHVLVANVGDSKALLCSRSSQDGGLSPVELTRDHNALIDEERARIIAAGGYIINSSTVPLVMGHFPMTRAIGDVPLKRYGVIAEPELTGWQPLSVDDKYLIVASDGIFESLSPEDICNLLEGRGDKRNLIKHFHSHSQPLSAAEFIAQTAYAKGSSDNLSVVVVPLFSPRRSIQDEST